MMEHHGRAMVLGIWEGLLICYLAESNKNGIPPSGDAIINKDYANVLGTGLAFGVGGRLFLDYTTSMDLEVLARGVVGMTVGVLVAEFAKHAMSMFEEPSVVPEFKRSHHRRRIRTDEEVVEGNVPAETARLLLPVIDSSVSSTQQQLKSHHSHSHSHSHSRPSVETTTVFEHVGSTPPHRVPILSAGVTRDMLRAGKRDIHDEDEDEDDEESLERDASTAEGQRKRLVEEKEWAKAKGDEARQQELDAEIKRYKALSAELELRLRKRRSRAYSIASSRSAAAPVKIGDNTLLLVRDPRRDSSTRTTQLIHLIPDPMPSAQDRVREYADVSAHPNNSKSNHTTSSS